MSSSLFADCYLPYPEFLKTWYKSGDKKFKDLQIGDLVYFYNYENVLELEVIKPLHETKGHLYLKYKQKGKNEIETVDFGETYCANTIDAYENSLAYLKHIPEGILGTTRDSVIKDALNRLKNKLNELDSQRTELQNQILKLEKL